MDGFFSMGCILIRVLLVPLCGKTLREAQVLSWWSDIVGCWRYSEFYLGWNVIPVVIIFSCIAFFGTAFVNSLN